MEAEVDNFANAWNYAYLRGPDPVFGPAPNGLNSAIDIVAIQRNRITDLCLRLAASNALQSALEAKIVRLEAELKAANLRADRLEVLERKIFHGPDHKADTISRAINHNNMGLGAGDRYWK